MTIKVERAYDLYLGGELVGTIWNVQQYWPAFQGDFVPSEQYSKFKDLLAEAASREARGFDRANALNAVFALGLEMRSRESNQVLIRTPGKFLFGEIAIIHVLDGKASFRLFQSSETGEAPASSSK